MPADSPPHSSASTSGASDASSLLDAFYLAASDAQHSTVDELHGQLVGLVRLLTASPSALSAFVSGPYSSFSLFLLTRLSVDWLAAFSPSQRQSGFEWFFSASVPSSHVLLALTAALRSRPPSSRSADAAITSTVLSLARAYLDSGRVRDLFYELGASPSSSRGGTLPPRAQSAIDALAALPDLLSNRLHGDVAHQLTATTLFAAALRDVECSLSSADPPTLAIAAFLSKLTRIGHARTFMRTLLPGILAAVPVELKEDEDEGELPKESVGPSVRAFSAVLFAVNSAAVEGAIVSLLTELSQLLLERGCDRRHAERTLYAVLASTFSHDPSSANAALVRNLLTQKLLVVRPLAPEAAAFVLSLLFRASHPPLSAASPTRPVRPFFDSALTALARLWSTSSFLHYSPPPLQSSVTSSLLCALALLNGRQHVWLLQEEKAYREWVCRGGKHEAGEEGAVLGVYGGHECVVLLMEGVQLRMGELSARDRREGMRVAVEMSRLMDPTHPLAFDDDSADGGDDDEDAHQRQEESEPQPEVAALVTTESPPVPALPASQPIPELDPDAAWTPETRLTSAWSADETAVVAPPLAAAEKRFVAYDLSEDRSDLRKVPLPRYLRDVLDGLRKQEERDHIEAALESVDALIRSRPFDLPDLAGELCAALQQVATTVFLEDKGLDRRRRAALVSLVVTSPTVVAPQLVQSFYSQSLTLQGKLEVLELLVTAAEELSGQSVQQPKSSAASQPPVSAAALKASVLPSPTPREQHVLESSGALRDGREAALLTREQHARIVADRVESKTRRWGRAHRPPPATFVNRFAPIAHLFFLPLITRVDAGGGWGAQSILHADPLLLANVLNALSAFIVLAAPSASTLHSLSAHLLSLLLATRYHAHPAIKRGSVMALLRVVLTVPGSMLEAQTDELREMREWLAEVEREEIAGDDGRILLARLCRAEMDAHFGRLRQWTEGGEGRRTNAAELELVVPNAGTLTAASSVTASPMMKFL